MDKLAIETVYHIIYAETMVEHSSRYVAQAQCQPNKSLKKPADVVARCNDYIGS